ncbi:molybdenum cofactor biosynthesis protein MoaE [Mycolicibacterium lutetiense]
MATTRALVVRSEVVTRPLDIADYLQAVENSGAGAIVSFDGVVRDHDHGRSVVELEYVGHPNAQDVLTRVAEQVATEMPVVKAIALGHRLGLLAIGDTALLCVVSAAHRGEAFAACSRAVEEVKAQLPVWKRQVLVDGSEEWVNCA